MNNDELTKAWTTLTAQLTNAAAQVDALTEGRDASERAEGYRFLTRILVAMTEFQVEQDANSPSLVQVMSPIRKFFVDNPDTLYHRATLNPALRYRIHGQTRGGTVPGLLPVRPARPDELHPGQRLRC